MPVHLVAGMLRRDLVILDRVMAEPTGKPLLAARREQEAPPLVVLASVARAGSHDGLGRQQRRDNHDRLTRLSKMKMRAIKSAVGPPLDSTLPKKLVYDTRVVFRRVLFLRVAKSR